VAGYATRPRNNLPPAVILPDKNVHNSGRVIPGQFAGLMGRAREPWIIEASPFENIAYGAYPQYEFDHQERPYPKGKKRPVFTLPELALPHGVGKDRFDHRLKLLKRLDAQRRDMDKNADAGRFDKFHEGAASLLTQQRIRKAFDLDRTDPRTLDRYGRNA